MKTKNLEYLQEILLVVSRREYRVCLSVFGAYEYLPEGNLGKTYCVWQLRQYWSSKSPSETNVTCKIKLTRLRCEFQYGKKL